MKHSMMAGICASFFLVTSAIASAQEFSFIALGDMPYRLPADRERFDRLIARINAVQPAFSIHVGDIKSGSTPCSDEAFNDVLAQFQTFEQPLVFTPGDNEWTGCHRAKAGAFDPRERLKRLREIFFAKPDQSLGKTTMPLISQANTDATHPNYVENTRFLHNSVMFIQVHVVGSNNGFQPRDVQTVAEFFARDAANIAWLDAGFAAAAAENAKAIVISLHANMYQLELSWRQGAPQESGFVNTLDAIARGAKTFGKPILVINGDAHTLELLPFLDKKAKAVPNVLRLQVMGASQVHAVKINIDPESDGVFGFTPLIVTENNK